MKIDSCGTNRVKCEFLAVKYVFSLRGKAEGDTKLSYNSTHRILNLTKVLVNSKNELISWINNSLTKCRPEKKFGNIGINGSKVHKEDAFMKL